MKISIGLLLTLIATVASAEQYGAPITLKHPVSIDVAVSLLDEGKSSEVLVEATVDKVCAAKGCWIGLKNASGNLHVTFKDGSFFVPPTLMGKSVRVQGKLAKATESSGRYELVASGLEVKQQS